MFMVNPLSHLFSYCSLVDKTITKALSFIYITTHCKHKSNSLCLHKDIIFSELKHDDRFNILLFSGHSVILFHILNQIQETQIKGFLLAWYGKNVF